MPAALKTRKKLVRLTPAQEDDVCSRYAAGEGAAQLMREYDIANETLRKLLIRRGIDRRQVRHVSPEEAEAMVVAYLRGESTESIAPWAGFSAATVCNVLRRAGIELRDRASARRIYPLNEAAFARRSPHADYWIGFIMADGCIYQGGRVNVVLKTSDRGHLEKLRDFIESPNRPISDKFARVALQIDSLPMATDLSKWGVVPRKSLVAVAKGGVESSPDFWRGVVDGDGTIAFSKRGYPTLLLCGGVRMMEQFQAYLAEHAFASAYRPNVRQRRSDGLAIVGVSGSYAQAAIDHLYGHAAEDVALDRKYARAMKAAEYQIAPNRNALAKLLASR